MLPPTTAIFGLPTDIKKSVIPCSCQERKRGRGKGGGLTYLSMICCDPGPGPGPGGPGRRSRLGIGRLGECCLLVASTHPGSCIPGSEPATLVLGSLGRQATGSDESEDPFGTDGPPLIDSGSVRESSLTPAGPSQATLALREQD